MSYLMLREPGTGTIVFPPQIEILDLSTKYGKIRAKALVNQRWEVCGRVTTELNLDDLRGGISRPALDSAERMKDQLIRVERYISKMLKEYEEERNDY